jgi:thioredoxin 1
MLYTNLKHIENTADFTRLIVENENIVIISGRIGPSCVPVYKIAEELEPQYKNVKFYDMEFDNPESGVLKNVVEYYNLRNIPLIGYFKSGNMVEVSLGIQTKKQITNILNREYKKKKKVRT